MLVLEESKRASLVINYDTVLDCIHFCSTKLTGVDNNLWFPIVGDLFQTIERTMVINDIALNVTSIKHVRRITDDMNDLEVTYNRRFVEV